MADEGRPMMLLKRLKANRHRGMNTFEMFLPDLR